jgi:hypothetical protein
MKRQMFLMVSTGLPEPIELPRPEQVTLSELRLGRAPRPPKGDKVRKSRARAKAAKKARRRNR